jgi:hypothetical protein
MFAGIYACSRDSTANSRFNTRRKYFASELCKFDSNTLKVRKGKIK